VTKRQRTTCSEQKTKNNNKTPKKQRATTQQPKDKEQQCIVALYLLPLYCSSLSFGRCIVALCLLVAVLLLFVFYSLHCLKEQQYSDQKTKTTIQRPKHKENNTATKRQRTTIQ
jgi:Ca2+/Na+ antiporter